MSISNEHNNVSHILDSLTDVSFLTYTSGDIGVPDHFKQNPLTGTKTNKIIFADDTASGRPCVLVDDFITKNIYPYYSNTHSNATCGILMKNYVERTREIIRKTMNLSSNHKVFFSGNGTTGAFNHLVNKIDFTKHREIFVHNTPFEHHSNFLPWRERIKDLKQIGALQDRRIEQRLISVHDVNVKKQAIKTKHSLFDNISHDDSHNGLFLDIDEYIETLGSELDQTSNKTERLDIFSLTACSNVTGQRFDLHYSKLWKFVKERRAMKYNVYLILDCACGAPYMNIDLTMCDGVCFSGHKFLGGQCTPGVLIIDENLIEVTHPYEPGGGCVEKADDKCVVYKEDVESREMGGTPNIVGIIRLGKVLMIKNAMIDIIEKNETIISEYVTNVMRSFELKYSNFKVINLDQRRPEDLPIYSVVIKGLHYNLVTVLFNDLFGVQTRGGISCCGTLSRICKETYDVNGWCRITFNYLHTKQIIFYVLRALEYLIINGKRYEKYYDYDSKKNLFTIKS